MRRAGVWLVVPGLVAFALPAQAGPSAIDDPEYVGKVPDLFEGRVLLDVKPDAKRPKRGTFEARQIEVVCDDGFGNRNFRPLRVRFHSPREFKGTRYKSSPTGAERYFAVEGRLGPGGRAKGFIMFFSNSPQPDDTDCSFNEGILSWRASKR